MGVYRIGEVIRRTRESLGISRKELCDGICTMQTLCRIETGKQNPNRYNFQALMGRMGKCGEKYQLCIHGDVDSLMEWEELNLLVASRRYEELDRKLVGFEQALDKEDAVNKQFLMRMRAIVDYRMGRISVQQKRELLVQAFRCTVPSYKNDGELPCGVFSRNEIIIFCNIATSYNEDGDLDKAICMLKQVEAYYQHTSIDMEERSVSEVFVLLNLARYLGKSGNATEAKDIEEKLVKTCLETGKGSNLANILYNMAYEEEIMKEDEILTQKHLIQSYYVAELFGNRATQQHIEEHINVYYKRSDYVNKVLIFDQPQPSSSPSS